MDISAAIPTLLVTLREGFEAALVVGIVLACLAKAQRQSLNRWVYLGVLGGILASIIVGLSLGGIFQAVKKNSGVYAPIITQFLAVIFGLVAIVMLSWMLIWMSKQAKTLKKEVETAIEQTITTEEAAGKGIFFLVFIAVLREGFETVLFILAKFQTEWLSPTIGGIIGLLLAATLGYLLFKGGIKLNVRLFFQVMGILLLLIVGGLLISVLYHLDQGLILLSEINPAFSQWCLFSHDSCILGSLVADTSEFLPEKEFPGLVLKALFGYRENIYLLQIIAYSLFIAIIGGFYFSTLYDNLFKRSSN